MRFFETEWEDANQQPIGFLEYEYLFLIDGKFFRVFSLSVGNYDSKMFYEAIAKLTVWGSFWNALRANRETDLMDSHGIRKTCAWIGNTPAVAMKNYRVQKGGDFDDGDRFQRQGLSRTSKRTTHGPERQRTEENGSKENAEKSGTWEHGGAPQRSPDSRDRNRTCTPCGTRS